MRKLPAKWDCFETFVLLVGILTASPLAYSQTFSVLHKFAWSDGANPLGGLTIYGSNLYGTTSSGGKYGAGTVFEMNTSGKVSVLYEFTGGRDGGTPEAALLQFAGNFYGTTSAGGASGAGTVFEITPQGVERVLHSFTGKGDGGDPQSSLVADAEGRLYGTTNAGGKYDRGTVFEIAPPLVAGRPWLEAVLYSFGKGEDGADPVAGVAFDAAGNLYGTTSDGGTYGYGTVFQLKPSPSGWTEVTLHEFELQSDGGVPYAGIVVEGNTLYGAATDGGGGGSNGGGTVFELTPAGSGWKFSVLNQLPGWGVSGSFRNLLVESGKIYATTHCDGANSSGTVYELSPSGGTWKTTLLYTFSGSGDGQYSFSNLVLYEGSLYGTTRQGGQNENGVVFKVTP